MSLASLTDLSLIVLTMLLGAGLRRLSYVYFTQPEWVYTHGWATLHALKRPKVRLLLLLTFAPLLIAWPSLSWSTFEHAWLARLLVGSTLGMLAWVASSHGWNAYFARSHWPDRLLVIALAGLILVHPGWTPLFIYALLTMLEQNARPGCIPQSGAERQAPLEFMFVFSAFLLTHAAFGAQTWMLFVLGLTVLGTHYSYPGLAKVQIGERPWSWMLHNRVSAITRSMYLYDWLAFLRRETVFRIARFGDRISVPLQVVTVLTEVGAILLLADRSLAVVILGSCILMHMGIFVFSGLCFWKWVVLDGAMIAALVLMPPELAAQVFALETLALSVALILLAPLYSRPPRLVWYDAPLSNLFRIELEYADGSRSMLARNDMSPYDLAFTQTRFAFLHDGPLLVGVFGCLRRDRGTFAVFQGLLASRGDRAALDELREPALDRYDPERCEAFDAFMRRWFTNVSQRGRQRVIPKWLRAPPHFWMHQERIRMTSPVRRIRVRFVEAFHDDDGYTVLHDRVIRTIEIPTQDLDFETKPRVKAAKLRANRSPSKV